MSKTSLISPYQNTYHRLSSDMPSVSDFLCKYFFCCRYLKMRVNDLILTATSFVCIKHRMQIKRSSIFTFVDYAAIIFFFFFLFRNHFSNSLDFMTRFKNTQLVYFQEAKKKKFIIIRINYRVGLCAEWHREKKKSTVFPAFFRIKRS